MKLGILISLAIVAGGCGPGAPAGTDDIARTKVCLIVGWSDRVPGVLRDALAAARQRDAAAMSVSAGVARDLAGVSVATLGSMEAGSVPSGVPQAEIREVADFADQAAVLFGNELPNDAALDTFEVSLPRLDGLVRIIDAASGDCP